MAPTTTETDREELHFVITYVKSLSLPSISKTKMMHRIVPRGLYASLSVDNGSDPYKISSLDAGPCLMPPFLATSFSSLEVKLFAKRTSHDDLLVAHAKVQLKSLLRDAECEVFLTPSAESGVTEKPVLFFKVTASNRFNTNKAHVESMRAALEVNPKLRKAISSIDLLIKVGMVISELNPIAKAVMELVGLVSSRFQEFIDRNESVVQLLEEVGKAGVLVEDWDDPVLDDFRPNQRNVCKQLLPEIYQCFYLLWALSSDQSLVKRVSDRSIEVIHTHRKQLAALVERLKSNQHLDTQTAVFKTSVQVNDLHNDNCINRLHCAKNVGPSASKACLPDTRVALLSRIRAWALHPTSSRTLLLHGAAGKGKSATVHTVARELQSEGLAVVPFFAFNRSMPDRSSSQLIPTWAKHLAEWNSGYLLYLHTLLPHQLESSDILDQLDALLLRGLDSEINSGKPLILILDAVDECPREEANQLFRVLRKLLGGSNLPPFVRFVFTYRPDKEILQTFEGPDTLDISIDDEEGTSEDIRKFVHAQLDHTDTVHMVDDVTNAAQTLFECAAVLCRELTATRRPASASARREFIRKLRTGPVMSLYGSYTAILQMYFYNTDSELVKLFRRVMSWVLLVRSPQSLLVFRAFADTLLPTEEQPDVEMILCWLGSLLSGTTSEDTPISPLHTSLWDFLLDPDQSGTFSVDLGPSSQHELSLACLRIMNKGLSFNICGLLDSTVFALNSEVKDLPERVKKCISPGLQYACLATAHHLWSAEPGFHTPLDIVEEAKTFFHHSFLFWLEAHSCMQTGQDGPGTILAVFLKWAMIVAEKELETTVLDYIRFEKRFREGYMLSAPQIYMSGLTFAPRNSIVSHHYGPKFRNFIEASGAVDIEWPPSETLVIQAVSRILSVAFSLDGTRIASGGVDHTIRVWDAATGQQLGEALVGHTQYVRSVAFSLDGTQIASASSDKTIRVWDTVTGKQCGEALTGHTRDVCSVAFSPNSTLIASGGHDRTIRVWDAVTGKQCGKPLTGHTNRVWFVTFSPDGTQIVSGGDDKTIRVWDTVTGQHHGEPLAGHTDSVRSISFSPDGTLIASGSLDKTIRVWDAVTRQQHGDALTGHLGGVCSVVFSPDGALIASGGGDSTIQMWDAVTRQQCGEALRGHTHWVWSVAFSPDGTQIVSGSDDKTIRVWDVATGQQPGKALTRHSHRIRSVAFSPNGTQILSGGDDKTLRLWDAVTGKQCGEALTGHTEPVYSVAFSLDGTRIISGSLDSTIQVWDAVTGKKCDEALTGHTRGVCSVAFSLDGSWIASGSRDHSIRVWDTVTRQQLGRALKGHTEWVRAVAFSPNGNLIASGGDDKNVRLWDAVAGKQRGESLRGHTGLVYSVAFSPDGTRIVSGSLDSTIRLWDAMTGKQCGKALTGHTGGVCSVAFSLDGAWIASGSWDHSIRLWNAVTGKQYGEPLTGHRACIYSVAFSPDGTRIVSGGEDKTIRIWDSATAQVGRTPMGHTASVSSVVFSPDSTQNIVLESKGKGIQVLGAAQEGMVQFGDAWFYRTKDQEKSYTLWIPHPFRHCSFVWYPTTTVISPQPQISLQFLEDFCSYVGKES